MAPGADEAALAGERPIALAVRLARAKAAAIAAKNPQAWVIGSDQVAARTDASRPELVLGKPGTAERCTAQLQESSGCTVQFFTAVAVMHGEQAALFEFVDTTRVKFRSLDQASIERYVAREKPFDCAGGFKSEGLGITLCESIESVDPSALIGLPLIRLSMLLREVGFELP
jgi:septum formation protein